MLVESRYLQTDQENPLSPFFYVLLFLRQEEGMSVEQPTLYGYLGCFVFCFVNDVILKHLGLRNNSNLFFFLLRP